VSGDAGNFQRRLHGASQVAAVKRAEILPRQPLRQGFGLHHSFGRERAVEIALANALDVPFRLAVADNDELGAVHDAFPYAIERRRRKDESLNPKDVRVSVKKVPPGEIKKFSSACEA
jgi:hypothetical protein